MRTLVVYESIFGNTRDVALAVAEALEAFGDVDVHEVSAAPSSARGYDVVVVGAPIHAWSLPSDATRKGAAEDAKRAGVTPVSAGTGLRRWLDDLPPATPGQAMATFDTAVRVPFFVPQGSAARPAGERLARRGFRELGEPTHFYVRGKEGPLEADELHRAREWARDVAAAWAEPARAAGARSAEGRPTGVTREAGPGARRFGYVVSIAVNLVALVVINAWPTWLPWTRGVVTADFAHVVWALNLGAVVQIAGHVAMLVADPPWLRRIFDVVFTAVGLLGLVVLVAVYPFHWGAIAPANVDTLARIALEIAVFAVVLAMLVQIVRVFVPPGRLPREP